MDESRMAQVPWLCLLCRWQVQSASVQMREGKQGEDNKGVCGPCCSCRRRGRPGLTDKTVQTDRGRERQCRSSEMEMGLQTAAWDQGAERRILVWHGEVGTEVERGRWMAQKRRESKSTVVFLPMRMFTSCTLTQSLCPLPISVCILMSTSLSVWICIDETVILFPCRPCVQLSTASTKTH